MKKVVLSVLFVIQASCGLYSQLFALDSVFFESCFPQNLGEFKKFDNGDQYPVIVSRDIQTAFRLHDSTFQGVRVKFYSISHHGGKRYINPWRKDLGVKHRNGNHYVFCIIDTHNPITRNQLIVRISSFIYEARPWYQKKEIMLGGFRYVIFTCTDGNCKLEVD